jgi:transposase
VGRPGRDRATVRRFLDALGADRSAQITHVSADAADWITVVTERCPTAVRCADPFHVVGWAADALDQVRRDMWNAAQGRKRSTRPGDQGATGQAASAPPRPSSPWRCLHLASTGPTSRSSCSKRPRND